MWLNLVRLWFVMSFPIRCATFLTAFYILLLKPSFSQSLSPLVVIYPLLGLTSWNLTTRCLAVTDGMVVLLNAADSAIARLPFGRATIIQYYLYLLTWGHGQEKITALTETREISRVSISAVCHFHTEFVIEYQPISVGLIIANLLFPLFVMIHRICSMLLFYLLLVIIVVVYFHVLFHWQEHKHTRL